MALGYTHPGYDRLPGMRSPVLRAALALLFFSGWMALLFWGFAFGGGVHLLLAGALGLFPWRGLLTPGGSPRFAHPPHPDTSTSTRSPSTRGPTPDGVPVSITSPGSRVIIRET